MNEGVSQPSCSTYFETLPDDIRVKLAEWLDVVWNEEPRATSVYYGRILFLRLLLSEDSPFRNVIPRVVTRVFWTLKRDSTNISIGAGSVHIGPELFEVEERGRELAERILKACGQSTKEICVILDRTRSIQGESEFASLVIEYCPAVESLEFVVDSRFPGNEIAFTLVPQFSSQLRSIMWFEMRPWDTLQLPDFAACTQIRSLSLPATPQLNSLLRDVGSLLENLFLTFAKYEGCGEVLDVIEQNCKKLTEIWLLNSRRIINSVGEERYAALLCAYGAQLQTAELEGMVDPEHLFKVFTKCPNLNTEYGIIENHGLDDWERIRIFGPRISILYVDTIECTGKEFCNTISSCTNLSELYLIYNRMRFEQDFVDTATKSVLSSLSTHSLQRLSITGFRATEENLTLIAAATSSLRRIELKLSEPVQDGAILKVIVDMNPNLSEVRIEENIFEDGQRDWDSATALLRILVNTFSECRSLEFGILYTGDEEAPEQTIRDICGSLPCRGIELFVQIGSRSYKQTLRYGHGVVVPF